MEDHLRPTSPLPSLPAGTAAWRSAPAHFFVLADSGKPVFVRHGDDTDLSGLLSLLQVLVAHFDRSHENSLRWIRLPAASGGHQLVFLVRRPLILVAASRRPEAAESQLRNQLHALHSFLLSQLTQAQLAGLFARRPNLDLRPLLGATANEHIGQLCDAFARDVRYLIGCVESVRVPRRVRDQFGEALRVGAAGAPSLLYGMILLRGQLVTLIRPKSHSLHPSDLLNVFTLVGRHPQFRTVATEHWVPVCLPKFNDQGFLYAYISYLAPDLGVVFMSNEQDAFYQLQAARERVHDYMLKNRLIIEARNLDEPLHAATLLGEPSLKHFLYKSKAQVQFIQAASGDAAPPLASVVAKYSRLHAALHDHELPLKLLWCEGDEDGESSLGWNSGGCEVYCIWDAAVPRATAIRNANAIVKWAKANEQDLFILESPTL
ncbi:Vacuolar fusion protein mon1 [Blastocladiella emersonii ATCC 22665]|nr:Vacuolar fusion protein mon1 [Blastocladiella emersonii ATCC 22665]